MKTIRCAVASLVVAAACLVSAPAAPAGDPVPALRTADAGDGIRLRYVETGSGTPVIFVHGSLSDYGYWSDQLPAFGRHYRAIAYSRRYNFPDVNPARPGYSAITDAHDLAAFIRALGLGRVDLVGHSYGALTALFLASEHPELVRKVVLAEPPAVSLLGHLPGASAATGKAALADIDRRMVIPMKAAYRRGDRERGVSTFIDYVFNDPHGWDELSKDSRAATLRDAHEWDVMLTTGHLFPEIDPRAVRRIHAPVLLMLGAKTYPFLKLIEAELASLIPRSRLVVIPNAGHQMWYQKPDLCRRLVESFLARDDE